jgi:hypothetical protein
MTGENARCDDVYLSAVLYLLADERRKYSFLLLLGAVLFLSFEEFYNNFVL